MNRNDEEADQFPVLNDDDDDKGETLTEYKYLTNKSSPDNNEYDSFDASSERGSELRIPRFYITWMQLKQNISISCSHFFAFLSVIFVSIWTQDEDMSGGGVGWNAPKVFNWHPILMVTSFALMTVATVAYKQAYQDYLLGSDAHIPGGAVFGMSKAKLLHASMWTFVVGLGCLALRAVWRSHDNRDYGFIANLYSLHSWCGIGVVSLFLGQFVAAFVGLSGFWQIFPAGEYRILAVKTHRYFGLMIFNLFAVTMLLGIQEKEGFIDCSYQVTSTDTNPATHYSDIPYSCRISHGLGIIIIAQAISTNIAFF